MHISNYLIGPVSERSYNLVHIIATSRLFVCTSLTEEDPPRTGGMGYHRVYCPDIALSICDARKFLKHNTCDTTRGLLLLLYIIYTVHWQAARASRVLSFTATQLPRANVNGLAQYILSICTITTHTLVRCSATPFIRQMNAMTAFHRI